MLSRAKKYWSKSIGIAIGNTFFIRYCYWYWQYFLRQVLVLVLPILSKSNVNNPGRGHGLLGPPKSATEYVILTGEVDGCYDVELCQRLSDADTTNSTLCINHCNSLSLLDAALQPVDNMTSSISRCDSSDIEINVIDDGESSAAMILCSVFARLWFEDVL